MVQKHNHAVYSNFIKRDYKKHTCLWLTPGSELPVAAMAKCEDGVVRAVRVNPTSSVMTGRCSLYSRTVRGFLTTSDGVLEFVLYDSSVKKLKDDPHVKEQAWIDNRCKSGYQWRNMDGQGALNNSQDQEGGNTQVLQGLS